MVFRYCSPEWPNKKCLDHLKQYRVSALNAKKPMFKHIGRISSLAGQIRKIEVPKSKPVKARPVIGIAGVPHADPPVPASLSKCTNRER